MIGRLLELAERYVLATENIALAQRENVALLRESVEIARRTADALERRVEAPAAPIVDMSVLNDAIRGLRELIGPLMAQITEEKERLAKLEPPPPIGGAE